MRYALFLLFLLSLAGASRAEDFEGTRTLGMGGAFRAGANDNSAIELNPAGMSLFKRYTLEAQYQFTPDFRSSADSSGPAEHVIHTSVVDNQIQSFATGFAFTRVQRGDDKKGNRFDLAGSFGLSENISIGANVYYLNFDRNGKSNATDCVTFDVGALVRFDFGLNLAVVGYSLTNTADYREHPLSMAAAVMYSPFRTLELAFDWFINFQKIKDFTDPTGGRETGYSYHFGAEYLLLGQITLRAGYRIDNAWATPAGDEQYWSVGAGWVSDVIGIDFGYRSSIHHTWGGTFGFGLRAFL